MTRLFGIKMGWNLGTESEMGILLQMIKQKNLTALLENEEQGVTYSNCTLAKFSKCENIGNAGTDGFTESTKEFL